MAARSRRARSGFRKMVAPIMRFLKPVGRKLRVGILYVWRRPIILSVVLLVLAAILFQTLIVQTFKAVMNCNYLIVTQLKMDSFFCKGYDVRAFGSSVFKIPGLGVVMDPPLEFIRKIVAWAVVLFFAFISLYLTIIFNNLKAVVKLVTLNKEQWKSFMAGLRTWLLFFVAFCSLFYFTVIR